LSAKLPQWGRLLGPMCGEVSYVCDRKNDGKPEQDSVGFNRNSMMRREMKEEDYSRKK